MGAAAEGGLPSQSPWNRDAGARQLAEHISAWLSETSARPLD
ncbi:hypothetical protein QTQ03_12910 [Micromonospora sp. WMMA1363]|nr:hypothetical protein [Micromonospora sp. WMMA1363]MDM4720430.1 hypothetical protein [Micromonospora sp. WMMA1363]